MPKKYRSTWNTNDIMSGDVAVLAGKWVEIGEYVVEAGLYYTPGYGFSTSQSDADGRIFCQFQTSTPDEVTGYLRIVAYTPDDQPLPGGAVLFEARTEALNSNASDRTKQLPFPAMPIALGEDYKFKFFFKADAGATIAKSKSTILIDITKTSKTA